jgi:hypothetical protein
MNMFNHQIMLPDGSQINQIPQNQYIQPNIPPNTVFANIAQPNMFNYQNNIQPNIPHNLQPNIQHNQQNIKRNLEKGKVTDLLNEMISNYKNKEPPKANSIDNQVSKYLLLFSVDPEFRTKICILVNNLYKKKTEPKHINEKTLRYLVSKNNKDITELYDTHNSNKHF